MSIPIPKVAKLARVPSLESPPTDGRILSPLSPRSLVTGFSSIVSFGMDIGGSLTKVVYFEPDKPEDEAYAAAIREFIIETYEYGETGIRDSEFEYHCGGLGGTLHFIKFQTRRMEAFVELVKENSLSNRLAYIAATGGGAHKFERLLKEELHIELRKCDELTCLVQGAHFLINTSPQQQLYHIENSNFSDTMRKVPGQLEDGEPYLLVNVGSGVSILRVDGPKDFKRIGGTSLGGATFLGLTKSMTNATTFKEALDLAEKGDSTNVDMLVRDIYGGDYELVGLSGTVVASSFGKMIHPDATASDSDIAKAVLIMVTNNLGSLVHLHCRIEHIRQVVFAGNFLENNPIAMRTLAFALDFWSQGESSALFLEHIGYSGAVGALIHSIGKDL